MVQQTMVGSSRKGRVWMMDNSIQEQGENETRDIDWDRETAKDDNEGQQQTKDAKKK